MIGRPKKGQRRPIAVRGTFVDVARVGSIVVLKTSTQIYVTHAEWIPNIDDVAIARIRDLYMTGDYSHDDLAVMFDTSRSAIFDVTNGLGRFRALAPLPHLAGRSGRPRSRDDRRAVAAP